MDFETGSKIERFRTKNENFEKSCNFGQFLSNCLPQFTNGSFVYWVYKFFCAHNVLQFEKVSVRILFSQKIAKN